MHDGMEPADDAGVMDDIFNSERDRAAEPEGQPEQPQSDRPRDEFGRFARQEGEPEQPERQPEPQAQEPQQQPEGEDGQPNRYVPVSALEAERKKFQERLDRTASERDSFWQQQIQQMMAGQQGNQQPPPDFFEDPDAAFNQRFAPIQQQLENNRLDTSEMMARTSHGDELVNQAMQAAQRGGFLSEFARERHPYDALVRWYKREQVLQTVGDDPDAYRKSIEEQVRRKVLQELREGGSNAMQNGQSQQPRFPTSLADQTHAGGNPGSQPPSREALMEDIFSPTRDRRAF